MDCSLPVTSISSNSSLILPCYFTENFGKYAEADQLQSTKFVQSLTYKAIHWHNIWHSDNCDGKEEMRDNKVYNWLNTDSAEKKRGTNKIQAEITASISVSEKNFPILKLIYGHLDTVKIIVKQIYLKDEQIVLGARVEISSWTQSLHCSLHL